MKMCLTLVPTQEQAADLWKIMAQAPQPVTMIDPHTKKRKLSVSPKMLADLETWMSQFEIKQQV